MDDTNGAEAAMAASASEEPRLPEGEYAIVEVMGHRTLVGRISEVERFGAKLMAIEPLYQGALLPAVMVGGASIYQLTPCTAEVALRRAPKSAYQLPASVAITLPDAALPAPYLPSSALGCSDCGLPLDDCDCAAF